MDTPGEPQSVAAVNEAGKFWFVRADVARALGYNSTRKVGQLRLQRLASGVPGSAQIGVKRQKPHLSGQDSIKLPFYFL